MSKLEYNQNQELELDGVRLLSLVKDEQEPTFVYSRKGIADRLFYFQSVLAKSLKQRYSVHYAVKANSFPEVLSLFKTSGIGADVVSGGELKKALEAGFLPSQIIFSGAGKTKEEIRFALQTGIRQLNVESPSELARIATLSQELNKKAPVVLRINPGVDAKTHPYISTGFRENKFGIDESQITDCLRVIHAHPSLSLMGLSSHIGSQITDLSVMGEAMKKMALIFENVRQQGFSVTTFDVGGGLGIDYQSAASSDLPVMDEYGKILQESLATVSGQIQFEPGRILIARCGVLLTQVQYIKKAPAKNFVICNSGMHHLIRPALYQAHHRIFPLKKKSGEEFHADVVGPICESSDFLGKNRHFIGLEEGDWLCVSEAGAYGSSMKSGYNAFPAPKEVMV